MWPQLCVFRRAFSVVQFEVTFKPSSFLLVNMNLHNQLKPVVKYVLVKLSPSLKMPGCMDSNYIAWISLSKICRAMLNVIFGHIRKISATFCRAKKGLLSIVSMYETAHTEIHFKSNRFLLVNAANECDQLKSKKTIISFE